MDTDQQQVATVQYNGVLRRAGQEGKIEQNLEEESLRREEKKDESG